MKVPVVPNVGTIGLGIAKKLVEDMEGQITCKANKPKGAKFRIEFPQSS